MLKRTSLISFSLSLPENSRHEICQIDVIFGGTIYIIANSSYKSGFSKEREEQTVVATVAKGKVLHPVRLCEDVSLSLTVKEEETETLQKIVDVVKQTILDVIKEQSTS